MISSPAEPAPLMDTNHSPVVVESVSSQNYAPSAPALPDVYLHQQHQEEEEPPLSPPPPPPPHQPQFTQNPTTLSQSSSLYGNTVTTTTTTNTPYSSLSFPPGTHPQIITSFEMVDKDGSGFIDERELQEALSFGYHKFSLTTVKLLMFLFTNPLESLQIRPTEFSALWKCLGEWHANFERFDRDRSGKIDTLELRDALYSLGYAVPQSVLQVLISKYYDGSGRRGELNFDSFVECGMIVKGLTEKFKEKDPRYTGSATLNYETFMSMVIPFIVT